MITKVKTNNEVFVYMNGKLLCKIWITPRNYTRVYCDVWGGFWI